jgi:hypothetical protein
VPTQHPVVQIVGSQAATQAWLLHSLPALHVVQSAPPVPQALLAVPSWQTPEASQQPVGQLVASHTQTPFTHSCPDAHATQAAPAAPHSAPVFPASQVVPLQQPVAQLAGAQYGMQACPLHWSWKSQATHAAPPVPHELSAVPSWQFSVASQQPPPQVFASHTHKPLRHSCPTAQATQAAPAVPQTALVAPVTQLPAALQQPVGQLFASQAQAPPLALATQTCPVGHEIQTAPLAPHSSFVLPPSHDSPLQQPFGHVAALQAH